MNREVSADLVRIARVRDLDAATCRAARALHHAAFGDEAAFLERLFAAAAEERYLYIRAGSTVVAGCFVCDAVLHVGDVTLHGGYLYALCTAAAYRRRGFAHALLGAAVRCTDDFLLTVPGSRSLCDFYRRAGFTAALSGCVAVGGSGGSPAPADLQPGTYADAVRAARRYGGLLLRQPLFELSLAESGAAPCVAGDAFCAVRDGRLFAAIGITPKDPIGEKALLRCKTPPATDRIFADLLLEV